MSERYIPRSVDAEQAVLGGLMLDNERWDEVVLMLRGRIFSGRTPGDIPHHVRAGNQRSAVRPHHAE